MPLRLVGSSEAPAPPSHVRQIPSGRPGQHHEPVRLPHDVAVELAYVAHAGDVPISLALAVLLEAQLAVHAVTEAGGSPSVIGSHVDRSASLAPAEWNYLEFISQRPAGHASGRRRPSLAATSIVAVPVRLVPFCDESLLCDAVRRDLAHALRWEEQAVRSGRTLAEWALRQALLAATAAA